MFTTEDNLRFSIIGKIVKTLSDSSMQLGKKKIQKLIYFLQKEFEVPLGYKYEIYHYGPYCFDLTSDLDTMEAIGIIKITPEPDGFGYKINTGDNLDNIFKKLNQYLVKYQDKINSLIEQFGKFSGMAIELLATIHFVKACNPEYNDDKIIQNVKQLKPKFDEKLIREHFDKLKQLLDN